MRAVGLFVLAAAAFLDDASLNFDSSPVSKVIKLLKDMQAQLQSDKKAEEDMYEKLSCWCKVNGEGKDEAVRVAGQRIADLTAQSKAMTAKISGLELSIKNLEEEVASNTASLNSATSMRAKDLAEFNANEKDTVLSIDGLKNALVVLAKSQGQSFLQTSASFLSMQGTVKDIVNNQKADDMLNQILTPTDKNALQAFIEAPGYAPQSGEIMGVLKQMRKNFAANLEDMQAGETKAAAEFATLNSAKKAEIKAGEKLIKQHTATLTNTQVELADAKEDHEDTEAALSADQEFLVDLHERCAVSDTEWEKRSKTRADEITAVSEAIGILNADDAHDLFHSSLNFLQLGSSRRVVSKVQRQREAAAHILLKQAGKTGNTALVQLASMARLDGFSKVTDAITGMVKDLKQESADEVDHKDWCRDEFQSNDMDTMAADNQHTDQTAKINDFASAMESLDSEIKALKAQIADLLLNFQRANENRVKENQEFQQVVADQRATQVILKKAMDKLSKFYDAQFVQLKAKSHTMKQEPGAAAPPPPPQFSDYKTNSGSGSVMTMLQSIVKDAADMETEAITSENDAQGAYETFAQQTFASVEAAQRSVINKTELRAKAESSKVATEGDLAATESQQEALAATKAQLHTSCDFVVANFDARQEQRAAEVESLEGAIAALRSS